MEMFFLHLKVHFDGIPSKGLNLNEYYLMSHFKNSLDH